LAALAIVSLVAGLLVTYGTVLAVHDLTFQLDGETTTTAYTVPGSQTVDWDSLFNANGTNTSLINSTPPPLGTDRYTNGDFVRDFGVKSSAKGACSLTDTTSTIFCTGDDTTFATGSKDTLDIGGWQCNHDNNTNSKIDIMNAYAAAYTATNGDKIIYFGLDKNKNNGSNNVGFWFLQGNASCSSTSGTQTFSGQHVVGDVLVVSEFSNGGGVSNVTAYKWVGGSTPLVLFGQGGDCKITTGPDAICATTNATGTLAWNQNLAGANGTKWLTSDATLGVGHTVVSPDFFEGGINLTTAFGSTNSTVPSCFNTFIGDTRSSTSLTSTLFDFARGQLGECSVSLTTTPSTTSTTLTATSAVTDTANLVGTSSSGGTAPSPTGTVNFFLCSPSEVTTNGGTCSSGGTAVTGNPVLVVTGTAPNSSAVSGNVRSLITTAGTYCFRAEYTAAADDSNYAGATAGTDNLSAECFTVSGTSTLSTAQNWIPNDTATIAGDSAFSGNLTFTLYPTANCTGTAVYSEGPTAVSGPASGATFHTNNPGGTSTGGFTVAKTADPTNHVGAPGDYSWLVHYADTSGLSSPTDKCEVANVSITD
jgi:hypothetical protein